MSTQTESQDRAEVPGTTEANKSSPAIIKPGFESITTENNSSHIHNDTGEFHKTQTIKTSKDLENATDPFVVPDDHGAGHRRLQLHRHRVVLVWSCIWLVFTSWWVASLILHHQDKNWVIPFLIWLCITIRLITLWIRPMVVLHPFFLQWSRAARLLERTISRRSRLILSAIITVIILLAVCLASTDSTENTRTNRAISFCGLVLLLIVLWVTSHDRSKINPRRVIVGILAQFVIALFVLRTSTGYDIFNFVSGLTRDLLGYARDGVAFITDTDTSKSSWFLITVVPPIVFFTALVQVLYHYGLLQWLLLKLAVFFRWSMSVSGAESLAAAACPFVGQGENAVLIGPMINHLSNAELHQVMCSGFGTIAGSVLGAYVALGVNPFALISSCVMSIPASLVLSHMRYPESIVGSGDPTDSPRIERQKTNNGLQALAEGAWLGLKVAGMILATVLCIVALLGLLNGLLTWWGRYLNLQGEYDLTIELIASYICYPIAFLLGVPRNQELLLVGRLIGTKIIVNEFVAYNALVTEPEYLALSNRSRLIATYALCGFGNISAMGIQIGVLSQIAPQRSKDITRLAFSALITGILSTLSSAAVAGMVLDDAPILSS